MFVTDEMTPVQVGPDTVFVRSKMNFGVYSEFMDDLLAVAGPKLVIRDHLGRLNLALMTHNIVEWAGPAFTDADGKPIPCTPARIRQLDPDDPLVDAVLRHVQANNPLMRSTPDPKPVTSVGGASSTAQKASNANAGTPM